MENTRFLKITIIVLLLVNIGTLVFMWANRQQQEQPPMPPRGGGGPGGAFAYLTNELKLDDQQKEKLEVLRTSHRQEADRIDRISGPMHHRFFNMLGKADPAAVDKMADSLAWCQKQRELITYKHFADIRALCTPEQQKRFDVVVNDALRMMARQPKGPGRPGGPPRDQQGPPQEQDGPPPPRDQQGPPPPRQ